MQDRTEIAFLAYTLALVIYQPKIYHRAVFVGVSKATRVMMGGGHIFFVADVMNETTTNLKQLRLATNMIRELKPILRTLQFVSEYRKQILHTLANGH